MNGRRRLSFRRNYSRDSNALYRLLLLRASSSSWRRNSSASSAEYSFIAQLSTHLAAGKLESEKMLGSSASHCERANSRSSIPIMNERESTFGRFPTSSPKYPKASFDRTNSALRCAAPRRAGRASPAFKVEPSPSCWFLSGRLLKQQAVIG